MKNKLLIACLAVLILSGQVLIAGEKQHSAVEPAHRHSWWTLRNDAVNERVCVTTPSTSESSRAMWIFS